jgi:WD40 repeat protein
MPKPEPATRVLAAGLLPTFLALWSLAAPPVGTASLAVARPPADGNRSQTQNPLSAGARLDRFGDPLPAGAITRLGTLRLNHGCSPGVVCYSPDGKLLASFGAYDGTARVWDAATGKEVCRFDGANEGVFSPDGKSLIVSGEKVCVRDAASGRLVSELPLPAGRLAVTRDGKTLIVVTLESIHAWDLAAGKETRKVACPESWTIAVSADGRNVAVAGRDGVRVIDVAAGKDVVLLKDNTSLALAFSPDGKTLASGRYDAGVILWNLATGRERARLKAKQHEPGRRVAFSPDGNLLAVASDTAVLSLWDVKTGRKLRECSDVLMELGGHADRALAFAPDGKTLAVAGMHGRLWICDTATGRLRTPLTRAPDAGDRILFRAEGKSLLTTVGVEDGVADGVEAGTVCVWDAATGKDLHQFTLGWYAEPLAGGSLVAATDLAGGVSLLRVPGWQETASVDGSDAQSPCSCVSGDAKRVAIVGAGGKTIRVTDIATAKELRRIPADGREFSRLTLSPDGSLLVGASIKSVPSPARILRREFLGADDTLRVWDVNSGKELWSRSNALSRDVAFSPDGKWIASSGHEPVPEYQNPSPEVHFWEAATGREIWVGQKHTRWVMAFAFSPDCRTLATGGEDSDVCLWETATGKVRRAFRASDRGVRSASFSPDGGRLATLGWDRTALVWDLRQPSRLFAAEAATEWEALASPDAGRAYAAILRLAGDPGQAVPLLRTRLKAAPPPDTRHVAKLVAELNSDQFSSREAAEKELAALGSVAAPELRRALEAKPPLEVATRLRRLADASDLWSGEELRSLRALEVLEAIGSTEARQVLQAVAGGPAGSRLTRGARESLERLSKLASRP